MSQNVNTVFYARLKDVLVVNAFWDYRQLFHITQKIIYFTLQLHVFNKYTTRT